MLSMQKYNFSFKTENISKKKIEKHLYMQSAYYIL